MQEEYIQNLETQFKSTDQYQELISMSRKIDESGFIQAERTRYGSISSAGYSPIKE